ncbi:Initiation factor 2B-like protein [Xylographa pallens]|nr:Initiation factor 2B-like protein [Xylographa pallens]
MSTTHPSPRPRSVVSSFLCTGTEGTPTFRISLFKRSAAVRVYQHLWAACSGSIDPSDASPLAAAQREILEETGLAPPAIELLRAGASYEILDEELDTRWTIWPFAWVLKGEDGERVGSGEEGRAMVRLDWEHTDVRFVRPEEVEGMRTVAHLEWSLRRVLRGHLGGMAGGEMGEDGGGEGGEKMGGERGE